MPGPEGFTRTPLVLLVESSETSVRLLERLLTANGYAVLKAYSGRQADRLLERVHPDVVLVGAALPDVTGAGFLETLRDPSRLGTCVPLLLVTPEAGSESVRDAAFQSGAWGVVAFPPRETELVPLLASFVRAKQRADAARDDSLVDTETGVYNVRGILKRVAEVTADATRHGRPVACVALGLGGGALDSAPRSLSEEFAAQLAAAIRGSDTVGRLADTDFVVLAPGTDSEGAARLAERILARVSGSVEAGPPLRVGYATLTGDEGGTSFIPVDLLTQATLALRQAQDQSDTAPIQAYQA